MLWYIYDFINSLFLNILLSKYSDMKNAGYLGNFCPDNLHSFMVGLKLIQQRKCFSIYGLSILLLARTHPMFLLFY